MDVNSSRNRRSSAKAPLISPCPQEDVRQCILLMWQKAVPKRKYLNGIAEEPVPVDKEKRFVPKTELGAIFTKEKIHEILFHQCQACDQHLPREGLDTIWLNNYTPERIKQSENHTHFFALLVTLQVPRLIGVFLSSSMSSENRMPSDMNIDDLRTYFRSIRNRAQREQFVELFLSKSHQFSVPSFTDRHSVVINDRNTILPYLEEEFLDRGGFGAVYKVVIHPEYCPVFGGKAGNTQSGPKVLVRKEFSGGYTTDALREKFNLEKLGALKNDHLIQIEKTYVLGKAFNILLPYASKGNLYRYLRESRFGAPQRIVFSESPIWKQMLGISNALAAIINYKDRDKPHLKYFGTHGDLKPQNVLVFKGLEADDPDTWRISDLGQADIIQKPEGGTSGSTRLGFPGTDAYAPPEYRKGIRNSRYDVWALGIILLEALTFVIKGVNGLSGNQGLDAARESLDGYRDHKFYSMNGETAVVKQTILDWIKKVLLSESGVSGENKIFAEDILELVYRMLRIPESHDTPKEPRRYSIEEVVRDLKKILEGNLSKPLIDTAENLMRENESILLNIRQIDFYAHAGQVASDQCPLIIFEDQRNNLRVYAGSHIRNAINHRQLIRLILDFQHRKDEGHEYHGTHRITFAPMMLRYPVSLAGCYIGLNDRNEMRKMQQLLLRQNISKRYEITSLELVPYSRIFHKRHHRVTSNSEDTSPKHSPPSLVVPTWIELWAESPKTQTPLLPDREKRKGSKSQSITPGAVKAQNRQNRTPNPSRQIPLGRIVIYCADRIFVIPFQETWHMDGNDHESGHSTTRIEIEPAKPRDRGYFSVVDFETKDNDPLPGIPLDLSTLNTEEEKYAFDATRVEIDFKTASEASEFLKLYHNEKYRWLDFVEEKRDKRPSKLPND